MTVIIESLDFYWSLRVRVVSPVDIIPLWMSWWCQGFWTHSGCWKAWVSAGIWCQKLHTTKMVFVGFGYVRGNIGASDQWIAHLLWSAAFCGNRLYMGKMGQADGSCWLWYIGFEWHKDEAHSKDENVPFIGIACSWGIMSHGNVCCMGAGARSPEVILCVLSLKYWKEKARKTWCTYLAWKCHLQWLNLAILAINILHRLSKEMEGTQSFVHSLGGCTCCPCQFASDSLSCWHLAAIGRHFHWWLGMLCDKNSWPHLEHFVFCGAIMKVNTITSEGE